MTREEAVEVLYELDGQLYETQIVALNMAIKALEQEPCCNCIEFKRYAKQMQSIPFLMHKEMNIPISECQKAYDVAIDYLRKQSKWKG